MKKLLVLLLTLSNAAVFSAADSDAYRNRTDSKDFEHHLELYNQAVANRDFAGILTSHAALREADLKRAFDASVNNEALLKLISDIKPSEYHVIAQILNLFPPRSPISKAIREQNWQDLRTVIDHLEQQHAIQNNEPVATPSPVSEPIKLPFDKGSSLKKMLILRELKENLLGQIPDSYFASQEALTQLFFDYAGIDNLNDVLPDIAKEYFFYAKTIPAWLEPHLGLSVQDLIDNDMLPETGPHNVLNLSGKYINDLTGLQNIPDIGNIRILKLAKNKITTIAPGTFAGLNDLTQLHLDYNKIITIAPDAFAGLNDLTQLYLDYNKIITIAPDAFAGLNNLRTLMLNDNNLTTITPDVFVGLNNLTELYLSYNKITTITSDTFAGLTNLRRLYLDNNNLTTIEPGTFAGLNNLRNLYLKFNKLTTIAPDTFVGLGQLEELSLSNNKLTTISPGTFVGLGRLETLYLDNNNLTTLAPETFADLSNLKFLYLGNNKLATAAPGTFAGLNNLRILGLANNNLTTVAPGTFAGLNNLQIVGLSNNNLTTIAPDALAGLNNLEQLYLGNNNIPNEDRGRIKGEVEYKVRIFW